MHSLGLEGSQLVTALFGFNLGIETAQLVVVALVMPSLWVLSTTRFGAPVRIAGPRLRCSRRPAGSSSAQGRSRRRR
jgi:ABC-type uncharacterized transport system permease subunit